jgi:predicted DsbA family dithiol-disulfide isomerase
LLNLVSRIGLSGLDAKEVLENRTFKQAVDRDWDRCHAMGVTAVPTFLMRDRFLVGAQPYPALETFVSSMLY